MSEPEVLLKSPGPRDYLSLDVFTEHLDLKLISCDNQYVAVNKLAFATFSKYGSILSDEDLEFITTDIASKELKVVGSFLMSGCIPAIFEKKSLEAFNILGISLAGLKFVRVVADKFLMPGKFLKAGQLC